MCELLGLSFNRPVTPKISFTGFRERGKHNPHGWGLAWYPDESAQVIKENGPAAESMLSQFLGEYRGLESSIFIGHVRISTGTSHVHRNTHPFFREMDGKEYVFAHNGNVESIKNLQVRRFRPLGDTDSEHSFCHLLAQMETQGLGARNSGEWTREDFSKLSSILQGINAHGKFNCLLSDGRFLFSYYDYRSRGSLYFTHRKPPYGPVQLLDKDWTVDLAEEKDPAQSGFIVATEKLTNEEWEKFSAGELIVFHGGKMVFSSSRDISLFSSLSALQLRILKILRESPNRMRLGEIQSQVSSPAEILQENIRLLLEEGFIQQDGRDSVNWDHPTATYYTLRGETGGDRLPPA